MRRFMSAITLSSVLALPAIAAEPIGAVWQEQRIEFAYLSLDMAYNCDLIKAEFEALLRHVGATDEVQVTVSPCPGLYRPRRHLRIMARFSTLVRARDGDVDMVKAEWSEVELGDMHPPSIDDHDCELLEHFQEYLLSTIEHEVVEGHTGCGATKDSIVGRLKLRVLKPVAADAADESQE